MRGFPSPGRARAFYKAARAPRRAAGSVRSTTARLALLCLAAGCFRAVAAAAPAPDAFGAQVILFNPQMKTADIQKRVDEVAARQIDNQFGEERDALLFEPGSYGSAQEPLRIQMGYYTSVAGL